MIDACQSIEINFKNYISNYMYLTPTNSTEISQIIDGLKVKATADNNNNNIQI